MNEAPSETHDLIAPIEQRYTANQPLFFPCLYMMDRFANVGHLVFMGEAQFTKFGHQARAEIETRQGRNYLTLPLKNRSFRPLNEIEVDNPQKWADKFSKTLQSHYGKQEGYRELKDDIDQLLHTIVTVKKPPTAAFVGKMATLFCMYSCGIFPEVYDSEALIGERPEDASEWVSAMGRAINCTEYLGGGSAMNNYIKPEVFTRDGIRLVSQSFEMTSPYPTVSGALNSDAWISTLDPLMVGGPSLVRELIGLEV